MLILVWLRCKHHGLRIRAAKLEHIQIRFTLVRRQIGLAQLIGDHIAIGRRCNRRHSFHHHEVGFGDRPGIGVCGEAAKRDGRSAQKGGEQEGIFHAWHASQRKAGTQGYYMGDCSEARRSKLHFTQLYCLLI